MRLRASLVVAFLVVSAAPTWAQVETTSVAGGRRPSLVVVISVDQLRPDYLDRFAPWFSERGFRRFTERGALFTNAWYRHGVTYTAPGHASIGTGRTPSESGIVGNAWFERDAAFRDESWEFYFDDWTMYEPPGRTLTPVPPGQEWFHKIDGSPRYCVEDTRVRVTAGTTPGMSPASLAEDSLGDRIKVRHPNARVLSVALKDRAAILMGGRKADAAYWFDYRLPAFISSSYYRVNPRVLAFSDRITSYIPESRVWKLSGTIPAAELERITFDPPAAAKLKNPKYNGAFDHKIPDAKAFTYTPRANDLVLDFALHVMRTENLGTRGEPDVLFVGLSPTDYIGHYYGPDSKEVAENAVLLDRSLARFLDELEQQFGDRVVVALTADHGVQSSPEITKLRDPRVSAGRLDLRNGSRNARVLADLPPVRIDLEREIAKTLRLPFSADMPIEDAMVIFFEEPSLYLNWKRIAALKLDGERVRRVVRDAIKTVAAEAMREAFTSTELLAKNPKASPLEQSMRLSFRADRSGDVLMALRENWIWKYSETNAGHGQPVDADMHVPLLLWGGAVKRGRFDMRVAPTDLAPTVAALLGTTAGSEESKVLPCLDVPSPELVAVIETALATIERGAPVTIVPRETLSAEARAAAGWLRGVAQPSASLPAGHLELTSVTIDGNHANVVARLGSASTPKPGEALLDCGTNYALRLERKSGRWVVESAGVSMC